MVLIKLYEPADPPAIPHRVIGTAHISRDLWDQAHDGRKYFELMLFEPLSARDPFGHVEETITIQKILCQTARLYRKGREASWRTVIPSEDDRRKVAELKGEWRG
jgi:hypothetical protein